MKDMILNKKGKGLEKFAGLYQGLTIEIPVVSPVKRLPTRRRRRPRPTEERFHDLYTTTGEVLGEGANGTVQGYKIRSSGKEVAVKIISKSADYNRGKILKEIELFHHCRGHDNIVQLREFYEEDDKFYLVFDKLNGGSLFQQICKRRHLTEKDASQIVKNLANALDYLHTKGIAHRDLKPENILCESETNITQVAICDFDLGNAIRVEEESPVTTPELLTPVGSLEYMAPEVVEAWQDAGSYNKKCDIWSLGVILYTMLCGRPPFNGGCGRDCGFDDRGENCSRCQNILFEKIQSGSVDFPVKDWSQISESAINLIKHMLVVQPEDRFTAGEVLSHPWLHNTAPATSLATPHILSRNNSMQFMNNRLERSVAISRNLTYSLINESDNTNSRCSSDESTTPSPNSSTQFIMDDVETTHKLKPLSILLSQPSSSLAQRRAAKNKLNDTL